MLQQCRIGPPENVDAAASVDATQVAVTPEARVTLEIRFTVTLMMRVAPEVEWHRRHGLGDDELPYFVDDPLAQFVQDVGRAAKRSCLHLAGTHRMAHHATDESGADFGSATA